MCSSTTHLVDYVVRLINATRRPGDLGMTEVASWLAYGASPRATLGIIAARATGPGPWRDYVVPNDIIGDRA